MARSGLFISSLLESSPTNFIHSHAIPIKQKLGKTFNANQSSWWERLLPKIFWFLRSLPIAYAMPEALRKRGNDLHLLDWRPVPEGFLWSSSPGLGRVRRCRSASVCKTVSLICTLHLKDGVFLKQVGRVSVSLKQMPKLHPE